MGKKAYLARLLPLDYLQKIGRYQPKGEHSEKSGVQYPPEMMQQLRESAGRILSADIVKIEVSRGGKIRKKKYAWVAGAGLFRQWCIPINWLVRVTEANKKCRQKYKHVPGE